MRAVVTARRRETSLEKGCSECCLAASQELIVMASGGVLTLRDDGFTATPREAIGVANLPDQVRPAEPRAYACGMLCGPSNFGIFACCASEAPKG